MRERGVEMNVSSASVGSEQLLLSSQVCCNKIATQAQTKICNTEVFTPVAFIGGKNVPSLLVSS